VRREVGDQRLLVPVLDGHAFPGAHAEQIKAQLRRINQITKEQLELFSELTDLINQHAPQLLKQRSIPAVITGRTAGAQRFRSEACFARHAGTAPIPATSGNTVRYRLHRGGDRQLNRAIHIIALGRVAWDPQTRAYIQRKQAEGKTKLEAIRCLKRHIARQIWHLLYNTSPAQPPAPPPPIRAIPGLMPCVR
jgi:transposase